MHNKGVNAMRKTTGLIIAVMLFAVTAIGCNMFKGAGKDMENAGESIQKTVDKND